MSIRLTADLCHIDTSLFDGLSMLVGNSCNFTAELILGYPPFLQLTALVMAFGCLVVFAVGIAKPRMSYAFPALRSALFAVGLWGALTLIGGPALTLMIRAHVIPSVAELFTQPSAGSLYFALFIPLALFIGAYLGGAVGLIRGIILMGRDLPTPDRESAKISERPQQGGQR